MRLHLVLGQDAGESWITKSEDADGQFTFDEVVPGTYRLAVTLRGQGRWHCWTASPEFEIVMHEGYDIEDGKHLTFGMHTSPFEVRAGDRISIEIQCKKRS